MLIPSSFGLLPEKKSCNNGSVLFGSAVSTISSTLSQLSHVKFLGFCNYQVMRSSYSTAITPAETTYCRLVEGVGNIQKGHVESYKFFYASTPISEWISLIISYEPGINNPTTGSLFAPEITVSLKVLYDGGTGYQEIHTADHGIKFDQTHALLLSSADSQGDENRSPTYFVESGINIPMSSPLNTTAGAPRPLHIPDTVTIGGSVVNVRGEIISINVSCEDCKIKSVYVFDVYRSEFAI